MSGYDINNERMKNGVKAEAFSDCVRMVIEDGKEIKKCFIVLAIDENDPSKSVYLEVGPNTLETIIQYLEEDLEFMTKD